jgi:O-antigen ligase
VVVTVLATVCLLLTYSRAGVLALVCEGWALTWILKPRIRVVWTVVFTLLILAASVLVVRSNLTAAGHMKAASGSVSGVAGTSSIELRLQTLQFVTARIAEHWLVGIGYGKGTLQLASNRESESMQDRQSNRLLATHSTFLDVALGVGLPGLVLFVWLMARIISTILAEFAATDEPFSKALLLGVGVGVIGLIVRLLFDHMLVGTLAVQFWVLVAIGVAAGRSLEGKSPRWVLVR